MSVQEEINQKLVAVIFKATKITGSLLLKKAMALQKELTNVIEQKSSKVPQGKMSIKALASQGQGVTTLDLNDQDIKLFDRIMKKFGVDYAVLTDKDTIPPTHTILFKGKDADAINRALIELAKAMNKQKSKPSVLIELKKMVEIAKNTVCDKVKSKDRERSL